MNRVTLKIVGFSFELFSETQFDPIAEADLLKLSVGSCTGCDFAVHLLLDDGSDGRLPRREPATFRLLDCYSREGSWQVKIQSDVLPEKLRTRPRPYLDWIVMIALMCSGQAVPLHACAVSDRGLGLVFVGPPDSGKTTMASQWHGLSGVSMLGDERVCLRLEEDGQLWVYGTLLPSTFACSTPEGVPLSKLFFLRHGSRNTVTTMVGVQALTALLQSAYPRRHRDLGVRLPVDICVDAVQSVPCYDLAFVPDSSVVEFVRSLG